MYSWKLCYIELWHKKLSSKNLPVLFGTIGYHEISTCNTADVCFHSTFFIKKLSVLRYLEEIQIYNFFITANFFTITNHHHFFTWE